MRGVLSSLPRLQAQAESLFTLTLAAYSPSGPTTDGNGYEIPGYTLKDSTCGKVQGGAQAGADTTTRYIKIGDTQRPVLAAGLHIPVSACMPVAGDLGVGWEYEVTDVGPADDPNLLGVRFLVVEVPLKSFATARRLDVVRL